MWPGIVSVVQQRLISSTAEGKMPGWWRAIEARADTDWLSRVPRARSVIEPGTTHTLKYIIRTQLFVITFLVLHYSQRRLLCVHSVPARQTRKHKSAFRRLERTLKLLPRAEGVRVEKCIFMIQVCGLGFQFFTCAWLSHNFLQFSIDCTLMPARARSNSHYFKDIIKKQREAWKHIASVLRHCTNALICTHFIYFLSLTWAIRESAQLCMQSHDMINAVKCLFKMICCYCYAFDRIEAQLSILVSACYSEGIFN